MSKYTHFTKLKHLIFPNGGSSSRLMPTILDLIKKLNYRCSSRQITYCTRVNQVHQFNYVRSNIGCRRQQLLWSRPHRPARSAVGRRRFLSVEAYSWRPRQRSRRADVVVSVHKADPRIFLRTRGDPRSFSWTRRNGRCVCASPCRRLRAARTLEVEAALVLFRTQETTTLQRRKSRGCNIDLFSFSVGNVL
jgi:hypothetical protein